ncbi:MAG: type I glyceraldehyde-3-phosphate dehydrogenase [Deltaproteobacteria bacterium]|jgi:glyceraldehyde 3-phosphate dehydrogenase|nr:type I glyceraldehyde-3-phosphate dehydrogenase [Deltaproteobacteria bacterium]
MEKIRVGINGFGRIGRQVFRAIRQHHYDSMEVVGVNDLFDAETNFHLLEYDTNYGRAHLDVKIEGDMVQVDGWSVKSLAERDPKQLPWGKLGVDVVVESTGIFRSAKQAAVHIDNGARKVVITAPAKDEDLTVVMGVNQADYDPARHHILSNASCTTNCLAPVAHVLEQRYGIKNGVMSTVHSYTNDQRILDLPHKDLRRARAAACNIIPTSTGAAEAVGKVIPSLRGKFTGYSLRVPTPTVSIIDFVAVLEKSADTAGLLAALREAAAGPLKNILAVNDKQLVSMDFKGDSHSSIVESEYSYVQDGTLAKVVSWYDNEWGYSCRVTDLIKYMAGRGWS